MSQHVLIIDLDQTFCQIVSNALEPLGLDVTIYHDPDEGTAAAQRTKPDLLLLAAELHGYSICRKLRKPPTMETKIVITSEREDKVFEAHQKREGAADVYLVKPISESDIITHVNKLLDLGLNPQLFGTTGLDSNLDYLNSRSSETSMDVYREELESKEQHIQFLKREMEAFRDGYKTLENTLKKTRDKLEANESTMRDLEMKLVGYESFDDHSSRRRSQVTVLEQTLDERDSQLAEAEAEKIRLQLELKRIQSDDDNSLKAQNSQKVLNKSLEDAQKELESQRKELEAEQRRFLEQCDQVHALHSKNEEIAGRLRESERKCGDLGRCLDQERVSRKQAVEEANSLRKECDTFRQKLAEQTQLYEELQHGISKEREAYVKKEIDLKEAQKKIHAFQQSMAEVQDALDRQTNELTALKSLKEQHEQQLHVLNASAKKDQETIESLMRRKETLEKNLEEVERDRAKQIERFQKQALEQKASFDDSRVAQNRENELIVRNLKDELVRSRKESETLISSLTQEKASQIESMRSSLRQLKQQLETVEGESHSRKEEIFSLNKKIRNLEEGRLAELTKLKSTHETEQGRLKFKYEEEISRTKIENEKVLDERNKQITAMGKSNKEYETRLGQLENKITQIEQERDSERNSLSKRIGEVESINNALTMALQKSKEEHQDSVSRHAELDRLNKLQAAGFSKDMAELKKTFAQDLADEKSKLSKAHDRIGKLEVELDEMYTVREANEGLKRELEKSRVTNNMLLSRIEAARSMFQSGLQELHGSNEKLIFESD